MSFRKNLLLLFSLIFILKSTNFAQDKSLAEKLKDALQKKYASLSILVRNVADFQIERTAPGNNGFLIENFRIKLCGDLDNNFGYSLETKVLNTPAILDAKLYYKFTPQLRLDFGLFKLPFSGEFLVSEADIDFVYRSQVVNALNIGKEVGVMISGETDNQVLAYAGGIFNGNQGAQENDNNMFLYVGRVVLQPFIKGGNNVLKIGLNAAQSEDKSVVIMDSTFQGSRLLLGGDINLTLNNFQFYTEAVLARLKWISGHIQKPFGYEVTAGYNFIPNMQLFARWDSFKEDYNLPFGSETLIGFNIFPSELLKLQVNYIIPADKGNIKNHRVLFNAQLAF